ncbi:MAG: hypothetical protein ACEPOV_06455 [Hyphomicrobiales bacterium]
MNLLSRSLTLILSLLIVVVACKKDDDKDSNPVNDEGILLKEITHEGEVYTSLKYDDKDRVIEFFINGHKASKLYSNIDDDTDFTYKLSYTGNDRLPNTVLVYGNDNPKFTLRFIEDGEKFIVKYYSPTDKSFDMPFREDTYYINDDDMPKRSHIKLTVEGLTIIVSETKYTYDGKDLVKVEETYSNDEDVTITEVMLFEYDDAKNPYHLFHKLAFVIGNPGLGSEYARSKITEFINDEEIRKEHYTHTKNANGYIKTMTVVEPTNTFTLDFAYE